jgi:hypothetical protein
LLRGISRDGFRPPNSTAVAAVVRNSTFDIGHKWQLPAQFMEEPINDWRKPPLETETEKTKVRELG